jgi:hypothetical protein
MKPWGSNLDKYEYDIWNIYDGSEYLQNILLRKSRKKIIINIKS